MQLSAHISLKEFTATSHADIANDLPVELYPEAKATCAVADEVRALLCEKAGKDIPILPSSGYRCLELNRAVGSKDTGDHPKAKALDFKAPAFGTPFQVATAIAEAIKLGNLPGVGQVIYEGTWVHIGTSVQANPVNRIITSRNGGYIPGIVA